MSDGIEKEIDDNSDSEEKKYLEVKLRGGISSDRITNLDKLTVIDDLIKCPICFNYLNNHMNVNYVVAYFVKIVSKIG